MRAAWLTFLLTGCAADFTPPTGELRLPIVDRQWDEGAPPEGWCGETSIQMAALHFGAWVPQAVANRLGHPTTPDLWEQDVTTALDALGLHYDPGPKKSPAKLLAWTVEALRAGHPVILGVKLSPSDHPEWDVDHLVLAVGFSKEGLIINSNLEAGQVVAAWAGLQSPAGSSGMSLINAQAQTSGYAVRGFALQSAIRLEVMAQDEREVTLRAKLSNLQPGARYVLRRDDVELERFTAQSTARDLEVHAPAATVARFGLTRVPATVR